MVKKGGNICFLFRDTWTKDGIVRGLYAGTSPALIANIAENSILFAANSLCQKFVAKISGKPVENLSALENGLSGSLAAFWSCLALCPTELVKCRLQAMREAHAEKLTEPPKIGPLKLTQQILKAEGIRGMLIIFSFEDKLLNKIKRTIKLHPSNMFQRDAILLLLKHLSINRVIIRT